MTPQEINKALAEKVMGWKWRYLEHISALWWTDGTNLIMPVNDWDPYTRIDHAMMCLEKCSTWTMSKLSNSIICRIIYRYTDGGIGYWSKGEAESAPAAICLAALKAIAAKSRMRRFDE